MQVLVMTKASSRWNSTCRYCKGRIRLNRTFVVDPEDSDSVLHNGCYIIERRKKSKR